jgi:hypothetical protein
MSIIVTKYDGLPILSLWRDPDTGEYCFELTGWLPVSLKIKDRFAVLDAITVWLADLRAVDLDVLDAGK